MSLPHINGIGTAIGSDIISPLEIAKRFGKPLRRIERLGIERLHRFSKDETLPEKACEASLKAIHSAGISPSDVSGIFASTSSTYSMPQLARVIGKKLELFSIPMMNISGGCAGGVHALQAAYNQFMVDNLIGKARNYLVLAGDKTSAVLDENDWETAPLFSEGIAAIVLGPRNENSKFFLENVRSSSVDGDIYMMHIPGSGCQRAGEEINNNPRFRMNGEAVFKFATYDVFPEILRLQGQDKVLKDDYFILHQATYVISEHIAGRNNISPEQIYIDGVKNGNLVGASVFFGLEDVVNRNLARGKNIVLGSFGADLNISVAKLRPMGYKK